MPWILMGIGIFGDKVEVLQHVNIYLKKKMENILEIRFNIMCQMYIYLCPFLLIGSVSSLIPFYKNKMGLQTFMRVKLKKYIYIIRRQLLFFLSPPPHTLQKTNQVHYNPLTNKQIQLTSALKDIPENWQESLIRTKIIIGSE